ncbi:type III polyketide synthase [Lihuaxuella thermophila]|uniref:Alkylresorcinol/alkylpyrone synthase n=1 Tax=Lihuaxuella thermophila TaxID=1173111 RepID=A0A1H8BKK0_9BACL|nr:3-oxoacyl-[acyl-carrier-protein] synthase III C-terminal domain-containing protein [Lihuaxuella thermophila]SEM82674.1 alkylresorcinol/alkylpyrone synthase [Lihuaxuella thermophila]
MPVIASVATSVPSLIYTQEHAKQFAKDFFAEALQKKLNRLLPVFENSRIDQRYLIVPLEWHYRRPNFKDRNALFLDNFVKLGKESITNCLQQVKMRPEEIDHILFVTTTGIVPQGFIAHFYAEVGLRPDCRSSMIWGQGCAGGAGAVARAADIARAYPEGKILVYCMESSSLIYSLAEDLSSEHLIQVSLFGDGAAAVLVVGDSVAIDGPHILSSKTSFVPDTAELVRFQAGIHGIEGFISRQLPSAVYENIEELVSGFLSEQGLSVRDVQHLIVHPGGRKILEAIEERLQLSSDQLVHSWEVLRTHGNTLSSSVLFVLEREMADQHGSGELGLMVALGPGLACEQVLLQWN